jgi:hypothetical protein
MAARRWSFLPWPAKMTGAVPHASVTQLIVVKRSAGTRAHGSRRPSGMTPSIARMVRRSAPSSITCSTTICAVKLQSGMGTQPSRVSLRHAIIPAEVTK